MYVDVLFARKDLVGKGLKFGRSRTRLRYAWAIRDHPAPSEYAAMHQFVAAIKETARLDKDLQQREAAWISKATQGVVSPLEFCPHKKCFGRGVELLQRR